MASFSTRTRWILFFAIMAAIAAIPVLYLYFPIVLPLVVVPIVASIYFGAWRGEMSGAKRFSKFIDPDNRTCAPVTEADPMQCSKCGYHRGGIKVDAPCPECGAI